MGSFLFLLYINDFCHCLKSSSFFGYADDTTFFDVNENIYEPRDKLTSDFENVSKWINLTHLNLNYEKTKFVVLTYKHST